MPKSSSQSSAASRSRRSAGTPPAPSSALPHVHFLDTTETPGKDAVGGKGFHLIQMAQLDLPVPAAAVLDTGLWKEWRADPSGVEARLRDVLVPAITARLRADNQGVLPHVSVRSSGAVSMPGMMDTILNVGITEGSMIAAIRSSVDPEAEEIFQADCYTRFLTMYGTSVLGISDKALKPLREIIQTAAARPTASGSKKKSAKKTAPGKGASATVTPSEISSSLSGSTVVSADLAPYTLLARVAAEGERIYAAHKHALPSARAEEQIVQSVLAVFRSWDTDRAILYRDINKIDPTAGTAVVIQRMVFGNRNSHSATGVVFSRDPGTGAPGLMGEFLVGAQGEDVVSGSHTPEPIHRMEETFPKAFAELRRIAGFLEVTNRQIQDIEFTVEDDRLYVLQSRTARCAPFAHLKSLIAMKSAGEISAQDVLDSLTLQEYLDMNVRQVDPSFKTAPAATGLSGSLGALHARVVFGPSVKYAPDPTVFLALETTPDDLSAIKDASGVLTARGGVTSHAAVVARGMGKVCVVGCGGLSFHHDASGAVDSASLGGQKVFSGDWITLDAATGRVWVGREAPIVDASTEDSFIALEDLIMDLHPSWIRATSSIDDLRQDRPSVLATYALDDIPHEDLVREMEDAVEFLTGTLDLTGRLDAMDRSHPGLFLCADLVAQDVFLRKKDALLDVLKGLPGRISEMVRFDVHLGSYEKAHAADFRSLGVTIRPSAALDLSVLGGPKEVTTPDALVAVRAPTARVPDDRTVISSRNALLSCLKR